MNILISILIPAYKAKYLEEAIISVLKQSYKNFELIIVNDASPENLESIVSKFDDLRIKYYTNEKNCGAINVVDNWNICLSKATGEYVMCMGDDDVLSENCLDEYIKLITKYPNLNVYHARTEIINENSQFVRLTEARPEFESVYSLIWHRWRGRSQYIGDFLYRTKNLKLKGGFYKLPLAWGSDDITAYINACDKGIANTQNPIFKYRISSRTITNSGSIIYKLKAIEEEKIFIEEFIKNLHPSDNLDFIYKKILINDIPRVFKKKQIDSISEFLTDKTCFKFFNLLVSVHRINISYSILFISLLKSFINKKKKQLIQ